MSLETTNKKSRENVKAYILDHFHPEGYDFNEPCSFSNVASFILDIYDQERFYTKEYQAAKNLTNEMVFIEWCKGLSSILDTRYYYNRSAVEDLGDILQQSKRERAQYTEEQAERLLTHLIYQELEKGALK